MGSPETNINKLPPDKTVSALVLKLTVGSGILGVGASWLVSPEDPPPQAQRVAVKYTNKPFFNKPNLIAFLLPVKSHAFCR